MADQSYLSLAGAQVIAEERQAALANSVMHLWQYGELTPSVTTTLAMFQAAECDFDNYAPKTIAAWANPVLAGEGWMTYAPTQTFTWEHVADDVGNSVGGHFLVSAGGDLLDYAIYDPPIPAQGPGQAVIKTPVEVIRAG